MYIVGDKVVFTLSDGTQKDGTVFSVVDGTYDYRIKTEDGCIYTVHISDITRFERENVIGNKDDACKLRYDLLPVRALEEVVKVLTADVEKYGEGENWKNVPDFRRRYIAAGMRHGESYRSGEMFDKESGLHALAHRICDDLFLIEKDLSND